MPALKLEHSELQGEQVVLHFANGQTTAADIAIGSDGANSRLRDLVTPIRPQYVGVSLVEGVIPAAKHAIPELWDLLRGSALIALGGERTIGMGTKLLSEDTPADASPDGGTASPPPKLRNKATTRLIMSTFHKYEEPIGNAPPDGLRGQVIFIN